MNCCRMSFWICNEFLFSALSKAYAVTALMKVYSFEKAAGRKFSMLPEVSKCLSIFHVIFDCQYYQIKFIYIFICLVSRYNIFGTSRLNFPIMLQCQSFLEELSASHSSDLQQRAYEFQAILGLNANAIENIMPLDASCEDIEVIFCSYNL